MTLSLGGPDLLAAAGATLVVLCVTGALYSHRFGLSHLLVFLAVGMLAGVDGPLGLPFDDYPLAVSVGNLALALILFDGGLRTRWSLVRAGLLPAGLLATVGVAVTALLVAGVAHAVLGVPLLQGLLLGAAVASTDASAVFAQFAASRLRLPERLAATIEVESAMNDPMAMVLTIGLLATLAPGAQGLPLAEVLTTLLPQHLALGAVGGLAFGALAAAWVRRLPFGDDHDGLAALLLAALGVISFALVNRLGGSGFLAVYLTGLLLRAHAPRVALLGQAGLNGYTWLAQAAMFLLLGLLATPHEVLRLAAPALAIAAALMLLARPAAVALCLAPLGFGWREQVFVSWAGLRGAVPIVLASYPVMAGLEGAWRFFDVALVVVVLSLLLQGPTLAWLARALRVEAPAAAPTQDR